jgi:transcriptional regulator
MSNYSYNTLPGFEEQVIVGAEEINGTGEVVLKVYDEADDEEGVYLKFTPEETLELSRLLAEKANEALANKARINHGD